ncbi:translation factor GTPase family protein [Faecalimonas umbilicata]|uniref:translation factor GTPase family protein n=1 Tax=Faecalimonas umbilicata TaxID=1912855 RepID=UPI000E42302C|nr:TetM/TetW/TetO/TetS family tetracycline resistance ribosomal protection protein [Faecalimonas umbilicata]RGC77156.1 GTP-binding protein [Lachnospiraceae bacterium AM25-17]RJU64854.1 GTP-binding protein [Coprococcus sp. AM27-12LB]
MENMSEDREKNTAKEPSDHICIGLLAHVDAGKTTLSESMLYLSGRIRQQGRVDHGNAYLDTYELERARGITIFSKQAELVFGELKVTLLDTPGHVDFSAEMERTLRVLDYAILVINGADGVQGHTETLWKLLKQYRIPVFLFINKMDQNGTDAEKLLEELRVKLSGSCIRFGEAEDSEEFLENVAMAEEQVLETYLEHGTIERGEISRLIRERKVFPCYFGSALKNIGVKEFLAGLECYAKERSYPEEFGAKVYKIARDPQGNRLTYLKVTGGVLKVRDLIRYQDVEEKVSQIRIYSGEKYDAVQEVRAGRVCAVTGLTKTYPGEGLGAEPPSEGPVLTPVLNYQLILPEGCDTHGMLLKLRQLEEEDPELHIVWNEELGEIHAQLMGEVQTEILQSMIRERFQTEVTFGPGNIVYKETIKRPAEGVGHFEPLRHYAEVHLLLEPGESGSGLVFAADCSEDVLDRNWQRLILTHLAEKEHRGVLTGSSITDMKITLVAGRAHLKHTEGGDFRQATYRAVRQGLKSTESVLLEPYYEFRMEIPAEFVGRALTDIQRMAGEFQTPDTEGDFAVITGSAPVSEMRDYQLEVTSYTKGRGRLFCTLKGYAPCHNAGEVIEQIGYDSEGDLDNPTGSVFCAHGAGFHVSWDQVPDHMHLEYVWTPEAEKEKSAIEAKKGQGSVQSGRVSSSFSRSVEEDKELEEIFLRTYGKIERKRPIAERRVESPEERQKRIRKDQMEEYLLVDGYNVIFAWEDLKELAKVNIEGARNKLMDVLCNYQGFRKCNLILVFDAYKVQGQELGVQKYHNIYVVYTKEAETADQYIEKVVHEIGRKYHVTVATSDNVEQVVTLGQGGKLLSARELRTEVEEVQRQIREEYLNRPQKGKNYLFDYLDEEISGQMEEVRLGKKEVKDVWGE